MKLWLKKKILKVMGVDFEEVKPDEPNRSVIISQAIMSNKLPDNPELKSAFIKHWFMMHNVSPSVVDTMSGQLIADILEIDTLKKQLHEVKVQQQQDLKNMQNGTENKSKTGTRHIRNR